MTFTQGKGYQQNKYNTNYKKRLYHPRGNNDAKYMYYGGCIFLTSQVVFFIWLLIRIKHNVTNQVKLTFGRDAQKYGVVVRNYHTYNENFNSENFMHDMLKPIKNILMGLAPLTRMEWYKDKLRLW